MTVLLIIFVALAVYGLKVYKTNDYDFTPIDQKTTSSLIGISVLIIILSELSKTIGNTSSNAISFLASDYAFSIGCGILFFISGFGLLYNHKNNPKYILSLIRSTIPNLYFVYVLTNAFYVIYAALNGVRFTITNAITNMLGIAMFNEFKIINPLGYLVLTLLLLYIAFFVIYFVGNKIKLTDEICTIFMVLFVVAFYIVYAILPFEAYYTIGVFCFVIGVCYALYYKRLNEFIRRHFLWCIFVILAIFIVNERLFELIDQVQTTTGAFVCFIIVMLNKCDFGNIVLFNLRRVSIEVLLLYQLVSNIFKDVIKLYRYNANWYALTVIAVTIISAIIIHLIIKYTKKMFIRIRKRIKAKHEEPLIG